MASKLIQAGILAAWAVFFLWLVGFGQQELARLLHPRLWWLVLGGSIVLILFLAVVLSRLTAPTSTGLLRWQWPSLVILLVPLLYFAPMKQARFDSQTFRSRSASFHTLDETEGGKSASGDSTATALNTVETEAQQPVEAADNSGAQGSETVLSPSMPGPTDEEEDDGPSFRQVVTNPDQFAGKTVEVVCQAMNDKSLPANQFLCYRFRITCCAADAQPVFLFVKKNTSSQSYRNDSWVKVKGPVSVHKIRGQQFALIREASITAEKEPSFPFVF